MELKFCPECKRPFSKGRSNEQNRYGHGVIFKMIADEMGEYDIDHAKDLMKQKFLTREVTIRTKQGKFITTSKVLHTSELTVQETEYFYNQCRHWAREFLNLDIPEPNQPPLREE